MVNKSTYTPLSVPTDVPTGRGTNFRRVVVNQRQSPDGSVAIGTSVSTGYVTASGETRFTGGEFAAGATEYAALVQHYQNILAALLAHNPANFGAQPAPPTPQIPATPTGTIAATVATKRRARKEGT